jgi:hypothetical protein
MSDREIRVVTRDNFHEVGRWAGATECWGLDAPIPAIHVQTPSGLRLARLGDYIVRDPDGTTAVWPGSWNDDVPGGGA